MKRRHPERVRKLRKLSLVRKDTWTLRSQYVRLRDNDLPCITCGKPVSYEDSQAGHLWHKDNMDYVEEGTNKQCIACNHFKHGNTGLYVIAIDKKYGAGTAERLLALSRIPHKFTREELYQIQEDLKLKISQLLASKAIEGLNEIQG